MNHIDSLLRFVNRLVSLYSVRLSRFYISILDKKLTFINKEGKRAQTSYPLPFFTDSVGCGGANRLRFRLSACWAGSQSIRSLRSRFARCSGRVSIRLYAVPAIRRSVESLARPFACMLRGRTIARVVRRSGAIITRSNRRPAAPSVAPSVALRNSCANPQTTGVGDRKSVGRVVV